MMVLGVILILVLAYFLFRKGGISQSGGNDSPLDVLKKRYVNGEISQDEFLEKREILKK